ncbi:MAG TPA: SDR family NAD(P)-dependent oxidoreductase [Gammaproteobacteria bacterium]|nr:SDR family NAD(P)-dependent oxidoreductase [Gammaproteobacteria bacterium]
MSFRLLGKTVLVTGASRGIGAAIAEACAAEGANLALCARRPEALDEVAARLREVYDVDARGYACDVGDRDAVFDMVARAQAWRPLEVLINNAGVYAAGGFVDFSIDTFRRVLDVNVLGVVHVTQAVLPGMLERGRGRVINIASTAGKWGTRNQSAYNASKHAVLGLTRCLALELAGQGVLVNAICPWIVDTDLGEELISGLAHSAGVAVETFGETLRNAAPMKRWVRPHEVAGLAVYLASDEASYVNGQSWAVDGGYTMV